MRAIWRINIRIRNVLKCLDNSYMLIITKKLNAVESLLHFSIQYITKIWQQKRPSHNKKNILLK